MRTSILLALGLALGPLAAVRAENGDGGYAIVVSERTAGDPAWAKVVEALKQKHHAIVIPYSGAPRQWLAPLRAAFPRYVCFVAAAEELGLENLLAIQRQTRQLDDDPYTDVIWGIVTGSSAAQALSVAEVREPLIARRGLSGDHMDLSPFEEGVWFYEGGNAVARQKKLNRGEQPLECTLDNAHQIVDLLNGLAPEYVQTSGHANPQRWNIGYGRDRGHFTARDGVLYGVDVSGKEKAVRSPSPKIYLPYRNCLVGLVQDKQSLALGWMGSAGVKQMAGYIVPTWNGLAGNGIRTWLFGTPGQYSYSEAFYFNQQVLIHGMSPRARACAPTAQQYRHESMRTIATMLSDKDTSEASVRNELAVVWDRDTFVFYGDPAWDARIKPAKDLPQWKVEERDGVYTVRVTAAVAGPVNRYLLWPHRVRPVQWLHGEKNARIYCDKFAQVSADVPKGTTEVLRFRGQRPDAPSERKATAAKDRPFTTK